MSLQILTTRDVATVSRKAHRVSRRCNFAVAVVGAGFFSIAVGAFGADLGTGYSTAVAAPSHAVSAGRRPMHAHPIDPLEVGPDLSAQHARLVDQLYEELMRRTAPGCPSGSTYALVGGGC